MSIKITTQQDENNQHAVIATLNNESRVYTRHHSYHVAFAIWRTLKHEMYKNGDAAVGFADLPLAQYRTTKAGKSLLLAK